MLPVILILVLTALDFGRAFYSWVTITNSARVAANYAAVNPNASFGPGSAYANVTNAEGLASLASVCPTIGGVPAPTFTDTAADSNTTTRDFGDQATVGISCRFSVITPIVGAVLGNNVTISASSTFTIRVGTYQP